jgi:hypothetical protein
MWILKMFAVRDGVSHECQPLPHVGWRCGACGRGRLFHDMARCAVCGAVVEMEKPQTSAPRFPAPGNRPARPVKPRRSRPRGNPRTWGQR